jgi:hypothetical protein
MLNKIKNIFNKKNEKQLTMILLEDEKSFSLEISPEEYFDDYNQNIQTNNNRSRMTLEDQQEKEKKGYRRYIPSAAIIAHLNQDVTLLRMSLNHPDNYDHPANRITLTEQKENDVENPKRMLSTSSNLFFFKDSISIKIKSPDNQNTTTNEPSNNNITSLNI